MKRKNKKSLTISIILLLVLIIGIGYAYLTSNLSIAGSTEIAGNTWDIHFENLKVNTTKSIIPDVEPIIDDNKTSINYSITLEYPGDTFEFTVDVVNAGTLPGEVSISELSGISEEASKLIDYSVKYKKDDKPVAVGDLLYNGARKTIIVSVTYKEDITEEDFIDNNINLDITYTLQYVQSSISYDTLGEILVATNEDVFDKYNGLVTDELNKTVTATKVYYPNNKDNYYFLFGGFCWQVLRTSETGGVKLLYRGVEVNGTCAQSTDYIYNVGAGYGGSDAVDLATVYGNSFEYDPETRQFTLKDTITATWGESTYKDLLYKFTCRNSSTTCSAIYYIYGYNNSNIAYDVSISTYSRNKQIASDSPLNGSSKSLAYVGFMFNKVYNTLEKHPGSNEYIYSNTFTFDESSGMYTLSGTQITGSWNGSNTHYTCWNTEGTCSTISYIFRADSSTAYYIDINDGKSVEDAIDEMLYADDVNTKDSTMKIVLEKWYENNFLDYTDYLEDIVYCNNRTIKTKLGWDPNTTPSDNYEGLIFESGTDSTYKSLHCNSITDQFMVSNSKARLKYPVGVYTLSEINSANSSLINSAALSMTPSNFTTYGMISGTCSSGGRCGYTTNASWGMRPVISLAPSNRLTGGDGTETNPWRIE